MQRLAKAISNAGVCSRRDAELLIIHNQVKVNGVIINSPATFVDKTSIVEVSSKPINQQQIPRLWIYYKPIGVITTHKDTNGRATVFDSFDMPRVISIGRLDLNSEGLLLLTNNGDLARRFELPSSKLERVYKVRAHGNPISLLMNYKNIEIDKVRYNPKLIKLIHSGKTNYWFKIVLTEGKNREIRKIFKYFNLSVNRLIRISYGDFLLGNLQPNQSKELSLKQFKKFL